MLPDQCYAFIVICLHRYMPSSLYAFSLSVLRGRAARDTKRRLSPIAAIIKHCFGARKNMVSSHHNFTDVQVHAVCPTLRRKHIPPALNIS